jgi:hypothetical protein
MSLPDAEALVELAEREGLVLSAAPCNLRSTMRGSESVGPR